MASNIPRIFFGFLAFIILCRCSENRQAPPPPQPVASSRKPPSRFSDTLTITSKAAIFFSADSGQLRQIRDRSEGRAFEANMHEYASQFKNAKKVLQKYYPGIKIVEAKNVRFIFFKPSSKTIDLDKYDDVYGLFLYQPSHEPRLVDMMNIDTELYNYFSK